MGMKTIGRFTFDSATAQSVDAGGNLPLSTATATCNLTCDGETVTIDQCGVFLVLANCTVDAVSAGDVETQLHRNGNPVPGAHACDTAAEGDCVSQSYSTVISIPKCGQTTVCIRSAAAVDVEVAGLVVVKLA